MYVAGFRGHPDCWSGPFTYERCCLPELEPAVQRGLRLIEAGEYRAASDTLIDLASNFFPHHGEGSELRGVAHAGFEKAYAGFQRELEDLPRSLDYRELLYHGLGRECEPAGDAETPWEAFRRCCNEPFPQTYACMAVFEMMMRAAGRKARAGMGEDAYFGEMSESWAFRHFTPSVFLSDGVSEDVIKRCYDDALRNEPGIANALAQDGESHVGILFAKNFPYYQSPKFLNGVWHMTVALAAVRDSVGGARPVHLFEVGAGYGALPWLVGSARKRLLELDRPIDVQSYAILDTASVNELQRWYLGQTLGPRAQLRSWPLPGKPAPEITSAGPWGLRGDGGEDLWAHRHSDAPLLVDLVDREHRDLFAHLYGSAPRSSRPVRVLFAVNSWHEMPQAEWLWYYNEFVSGPSSRLAADWIVYVANQEWDASDSKHALLMQGGPGYRFEVELQHCAGRTPGEDLSCLRLLRRVT